MDITQMTLEEIRKTLPIVFEHRTYTAFKHVEKHVNQNKWNMKWYLDEDLDTIKKFELNEEIQLLLDLLFSMNISIANIILSGNDYTKQELELKRLEKLLKSKIDAFLDAVDYGATIDILEDLVSDEAEYGFTDKNTLDNINLAIDLLCKHSK